jgi:hypothetical protein
LVRIERETAIRLLVQMMLGSAKLVLESDSTRRSSRTPSGQRLSMRSSRPVKRERRWARQRRRPPVTKGFKRWLLST